LRPPTRDERDFLVGAVGNWCVCIDNVSDLQPWLSDALCRLSTGGGFAARTLYTDCDETAIQIQRPVILNGIDVGAVRGDLISRVIAVPLSPIPEDQRLLEKELWSQFKEAAPLVFGVLLTALSQAVRDLSTVILQSHPRMADFARLVVAAETALGFEAGEFMRAYNKNLKAGAMTALEASLVAQALIAFIRKQQEWTGTAEDLRLAIVPWTHEGLDDPRARWPKTPRGMSAALTRLAPALRRIQICIEHLERSDAKGTRLLRLVCKVPAQPSESSDPLEARWDAGSGTDGSKRSDDSTVRESSNRQRPSEKNNCEINGADGSDGSDDSAGAFHDGGALPEGQVEVEV
jgi:hypothetical protein